MHSLILKIIYQGSLVVGGGEDSDHLHQFKTTKISPILHYNDDFNLQILCNLNSNPWNWGLKFPSDAFKVWKISLLSRRCGRTMASISLAGILLKGFQLSEGPRDICHCATRQPSSVSIRKAYAQSVAADTKCPMHDRESIYVEQKCNYSSSKFFVKSGGLLQ